MYYLTIFFNAVVTYVVLVLLMRLLGKRQLGELELPELVVTVLISQVASVPISDPDHPLLGGLLPVVTLMGLGYILSFLSVKSVKLRAILSGKPSLLIVHGKIDQQEMKRNRFTPDELTEAIRSQGYLDLNTVDYAILETDGHLNIIPTPENTPATAGQLGLSVRDTGYPFILINSGRLLSENLRLLGRDENWLRAKLKAQGLSAPAQVYLMTADKADNIFIARRED